MAHHTWRAQLVEKLADFARDSGYSVFFSLSLNPSHKEQQVVANVGMASSSYNQYVKYTLPLDIIVLAQ